MKKRPIGFLEGEYDPEETEIGNYIRELHEYLWGFIHAVAPGASGNLTELVDAALKEAQNRLA